MYAAPRLDLRLVDGRSRVVCRPLDAVGGTTTGAVDLEQCWPVRPSHDDSGHPIEYERSIVGALLGLATGDETRRLDLAASVGVDWARKATRRDALSTYDAPAGADVAKLLEDGIEVIKGDLDALLGAVLEPDDEWDAEAVEKLDTLDRLASRVEVGTSTVAPLGPIYRSDDIVALAAVELLLRWERGQSVTRCGHCQCLFFSEERSDERYCRRTSPGEGIGGSTCRDVGPQRRYAANIDPYNAEYRKRLKVMDQRRRRGQIDDSIVEEWRVGARELLAEAREVQPDVEDFIALLVDLEQSAIEYAADNRPD